MRLSRRGDLDQGHDTKPGTPDGLRAAPPRSGARRGPRLPALAGGPGGRPRAGGADAGDGDPAQEGGDGRILGPLSDKSGLQRDDRRDPPAAAAPGGLARRGGGGGGGGG